METTTETPLRHTNHRSEDDDDEYVFYRPEIEMEDPDQVLQKIISDKCDAFRDKWSSQLHRSILDEKTHELARRASQTAVDTIKGFKSAPEFGKLCYDLRILDRDPIFKRIFTMQESYIKPVAFIDHPSRCLGKQKQSCWCLRSESEVPHITSPAWMFEELEKRTNKASHL